MNTRQRTSLRSEGIALSLLLMMAQTTLAGEAATSASAGSNGSGPGTATAGAEYRGGGPAYAQTRTQSGRVSFARGVAFGIDRNGISFSASHAVAGRRGPAIASNFNLSIGFDGQASSSNGLSIARGSRSRFAEAGGFTRADRWNPSSGSFARGRTGPRGRVRAWTQSRTSRRRHLWGRRS